MMRIPRPSHPTVVAYLALFAALGGSAYAVSKVGTNDLKRSAVTSAKIKNKTIKGADVRNHALGGKQINESKLNLSKALQSSAADAAGPCTVTAGTSAVCATTTDFDIPARGAQVMAIAYGSLSGAGSSASCQLQGAGPADRDAIVLRVAGPASDGFSVAAAGPLNPGVRSLSLVCAGISGTATINAPRIRAIAFAP